MNTHSKIGANGLGEAYVRALVTAGYVSKMASLARKIIDQIIRARVCIGDSDEERGRKLEQDACEGPYFFGKQLQGPVSDRPYYTPTLIDGKSAAENGHLGRWFKP